MARKSIYPPSVTPGIPRLGQKPEGWTETTFGDVLQVVERRAEVHDDDIYQLVTAKRNRGGIVPRSKLLGRNILTKTQHLIRQGDFLISKRQIIHGACGVVPQELDGALVSNEYATLRVKDGLLLAFLRYFCHSVYFQQTCFQCSIGVDVEKMIFDMREWLEYRVFLPSLPEQQRISDLLGTWGRAISLTEQRIKAAQRRKDGLAEQLLTGQQRFCEFGAQTWKELCVQDAAVVNPPKPKHLLDNTRVTFLAMSDVSETGRVITSSSRSYKGVATGFTSFQDGDVLVAKITPCFENGKGALVENLKNGFGFGSTEFHVIRADSGCVLPQFIYYCTMTRDFRRKGEASMVGSAGQKRVPTRFIKNYEIRLPPMQEQHKIVTILQACDQEIELLTRKLDALQYQKKGLMQQLLTGRVRVKA